MWGWLFKLPALLCARLWAANCTFWGATVSRGWLMTRANASSSCSLSLRTPLQALRGEQTLATWSTKLLKKFLHVTLCCSAGDSHCLTSFFPSPVFLACISFLTTWNKCTETSQGRTIAGCQCSARTAITEITLRYCTKNPPKTKTPLNLAYWLSQSHRVHRRWLVWCSAFLQR